MGEFTRPVEFTDVERKAMFLFREFYRDPTMPRSLTKDDVIKRILLSDDEYQILMDRFGDMGIVEEDGPRALADGPYDNFRIDSRVCDIAHGIELEDAKAVPPDLVEGLERKVRSHPYWSLVIIGVVFVTVLLTLVNGAFDLVRNVRETVWPTEVEKP